MTIGLDNYVIVISDGETRVKLERDFHVKRDLPMSLPSSDLSCNMIGRSL